MILNEKSTDHDGNAENDVGYILTTPTEIKKVCVDIRNYHDIVDAYGLREATRAVDVLLRRIKRAFGPGSVVTRKAADRIDRFKITGWDAAVLGFDQNGADIDQWLESLFADMVLEPIWLDGDPVHLDLAPDGVGPGWRDSRVTPGRQATVSGLESDFGRRKWGCAYRADMALVSPVLAALGGFSRSEREDPNVNVCWRPICAERSPGSAVFFEASLGIIEANGQFVIADRALEAAERIGLVHLIDQYLVSRVVEELVSAPSAVSLSVSVSGRCLMNSRFWRNIIDRLKRGGAVMRDLIVEIRGGVICDTNTGWSDTIDQLKSSGCRISLANFGLGATSLGDVASFSPDIVTVDKQFLSPAGQVRFSKAVLSHLVALAQALGAEVVIDGIDSFELASASQSLGASLFKGGWFGRPRIYRSWAHRSEVTENYIYAS
jgi:EAL domain-containing protein (putative c-di-GMP-specific phosphodiesterase class I)